MRRRDLCRASLGLALLAAALTGTSGCSSHQLRWTGSTLARTTVDSLLGFPAVSVVTGAGDVLEAGSTHDHEVRVDALSTAYRDFTDDRYPTDPVSDAEPLPVVYDEAAWPAATD